MLKSKFIHVITHTNRSLIELPHIYSQRKGCNLFLNCTLLEPEGNTRVEHLLSGHCTHQQIRSSSTLTMNILILATLL